MANRVLEVHKNVVKNDKIKEFKEDKGRILEHEKDKIYKPKPSELVCMIFDMDGTLTEPWFGVESPDFYKDERDAVLRSSQGNTYEFVQPLPYVEEFLSACEHSALARVDFKCLTRIVNGKEYLDKVDYLKITFPNTNFEVLGAISEEDKLIYLEQIANSGKYSKVFYFDDTIGTLNQVGNLVTDTFILCCHSTAMLTRTVPHLHKAWRIEKSLAEEWRRNNG